MISGQPGPETIYDLVTGVFGEAVSLATVDKMKEEEKQQLGEAETARQAWDKSKEALAKKTFDARASPYVE